MLRLTQAQSAWVGRSRFARKNIDIRQDLKCNFMPLIGEYSLTRYYCRSTLFTPLTRSDDVIDYRK
uniref:Uncharacterized protein n=1 Tax=Candidatus Kentrum sp. SD TaxID=2126332 RepID=A0A450YX71_9GAMM|nr:MAG: hypothetical protein BECKSD772F_GA0070984_10629 [Candidatus Kentron sp. SD]VFK46049.1 MAG: hypothetical protein BECKSD772E_GA0070983_10668 [Candidatus Kentron sp. SD]VFK78399.1 MAG: hypothetical protein BECKSD772D_GA0070982_10144 [Candidatus Kentron sp. SD]